MVRTSVTIAIELRWYVRNLAPDSGATAAQRGEYRLRLREVFEEWLEVDPAGAKAWRAEVARVSARAWASVDPCAFCRECRERRDRVLEKGDGA